MPYQLSQEVKIMTDQQRLNRLNERAEAYGLRLFMELAEEGEPRFTYGRKKNGFTISRTTSIGLNELEQFLDGVKCAIDNGLARRSGHSHE